jgi:hypothetical protein
VEKVYRVKVITTYERLITTNARNKNEAMLRVKQFLNVAKKTGKIVSIKEQVCMEE